MDLTLFGPTDDHGAVTLHLAIDGAGFLLDAGLDTIRSGWEALPDIELLDRFPERYPVDWILLSHAHIDHMGALPELARRLPDAGILCTEETWELVRLQLCRHASIWERIYEEGSSADYPLFTPADVQDLADRVRFIAKGERVQLESMHGPQPVPVTAFDAGHILGSCGWLVESPRCSMYYTGDVCGRPQSVIQGAVFPPEADIVISETTIAWSEKHLKRSRKEEIDRMAAGISEVAGLGGSILIPVFNMGRAQELLYILHNLKRKNRIPPLPVHLGRSAWEIAQLYDRFAAGDRRLLPDFKFHETLVDVVDDLLEDEMPADSRIYLVPSGMINENSPAWHIARRLISHPVHAVMFVGHAKGGSFAKQLIESAQGDELDFDGELVPRHCRVESYLFSSHSNRSELLSMLKRIQPKQLVLLPGRKDSVERLRAEALELLPGLRVDEALPGVELRLEA